MSEHRSILEKLTRLRDQIPTTQLAMERAQELLDAFNEHPFARYLDGQQDLLQLVEDFAGGRHLDEDLLREATRPPKAEEQQLETARFWAQSGNWNEAAKALDCTIEEAKELLPDLARAYRDQELQLELLLAKAQDACQRAKPPQESLPEEEKTGRPPAYLEDQPEKYKQDRRRWTGWGVG